MAQRRARILSAAAKLIHRTGGTDFTMIALAREAEVSPATPFNLFGTKEALLYELLLRSLSEFFPRAPSHQSDDPLERVVAAAVDAVNVFLERPKQLRPLYRSLLGVIDPKSRPELLQRMHRYWRISLEAALAQKWMTEAEVDAVSSGLLAYILGALDMWVHRDVTDAEFENRMIYAVLLHMSPFAKPKWQPRLRVRLKDSMQALAKAR